MPSPPIETRKMYPNTTVLLKFAVEYILRVLQVKKITFTSYDLASNEDAKRLWKRKAPLSKQQLPGILVGGMFPGSFEEFEEAVEYDELDRFLRLKEDWASDAHDTPSLEVKPIGVPGASSPLQMTNQKPSFSSKTPPPKDEPKEVQEVDAGSLLGDTSLHGISVTEDELADLVKDLGLEGQEAGDLVKGLSSSAGSAIDSRTTDERPVVTSATTEKHDREKSVDADPRTSTIEVQSDKELVKTEKAGEPPS